MNKNTLLLLLTLLKIYRATFTWSTKTDQSGHDIYRQHVDKVIHDIRIAIEHGGFYSKLRVREYR